MSKKNRNFAINQEVPAVAASPEASNQELTPAEQIAASMPSAEPVAEVAAVATSPAKTEASVVEKQNATKDKILAGVSARGLVVAFTESQEAGKLVLKADGFPTIQIGKQGGITLLELRSYPQDATRTATDAAINGDVLLAKQTARDEKKKAASTKAAADLEAAQKVIENAAAIAAEPAPVEATSIQ